MPSQSVAAIEAEIASLTSDITALNTQIAPLQSSLTLQQAKLPGLSTKYNIAKQRLDYVIAKAKKAGTKKKDWQCYDRPDLFPSSGGCYDRDHWNGQWTYYRGVATKALNAYNTQRNVVSSVQSQLNVLEAARDDKVNERNKAVLAKNALVKSESDAVIADATADAMTNPTIVKAGLEAEQAKTEAKLASNRKTLLNGLAILAFVVVAFLVIRQMN